jgi:predicted HicB family RNase H-like nuclease
MRAEGYVMFVKDMKHLIKYAIELEISGLECKVGYKGDSVLRISSSSEDTLVKIERFCSKAGIEYKKIYNNTKITTDIFCVFHADTYSLKD